MWHLQWYVSTEFEPIAHASRTAPALPFENQPITPLAHRAISRAPMASNLLVSKLFAGKTRRWGPIANWDENAKTPDLLGAGLGLTTRVLFDLFSANVTRQ